MFRVRRVHPGCIFRAQNMNPARDARCAGSRSPPRRALTIAGIPGCQLLDVENQESTAGGLIRPGAIKAGDNTDVTLMLNEVKHKCISTHKYYYTYVYIRHNYTYA